MTKKVTCTLPNAAEEINGIAFEPIEGGVVACGLSEKQAEGFDGIPGYVIEDDSDDEKPMTAAEKKAAAKAKREAEEAEAKTKADAEAAAKKTEAPTE